MKSTRASRIIAIIIALNVLLGLLAAGVILSPEYYALDQAIRKGMSLPRPPEQVLAAVIVIDRPWFVPAPGSCRRVWRDLRMNRRLWLAPPKCNALCRLRRVVVMAARSLFESSDVMLRAYIATVDMGTVNGSAIKGLQEAAPAYFGVPLEALDRQQCAALVEKIEAHSALAELGS